MTHTFELDDQRLNGRQPGEAAPPTRSSHSSPAQPNGARALRSTALGRSAGPGAAPGSDYDSFAARTQTPTPTVEEVEGLRGEIENLREVLNQMLDMIAEATEDRADQDRRAWLLNDRMGMVERRIHELEWNGGSADMNHETAAH